MTNVCDWCKVEKNNSTNTCTGNAIVVFSDGQELPAIPFEGVSEEHHCPTCNVKHGGFHHPGCNWERCPKCNGQLVRCGCLEETKT
jgi:hypothetical protein